MSRIGKMPITVPKGVEVHIEGTLIKVRGPKGELRYVFPGDMKVSLSDGEIHVQRPSDTNQHRALHGMTRALIQNIITGVSSGFEKILEVNGVGYRAEMDGKTLVLYVGYSHPVRMDPPEGISFDVDVKTRQIKVMGIDKQLVGQIAADVRSVRSPEPYKGKGIRYIDEVVRRKTGKAGKGK